MGVPRISISKMQNFSLHILLLVIPILRLIMIFIGVFQIKSRVAAMFIAVAVEMV